MGGDAYKRNSFFLYIVGPISGVGGGGQYVRRLIKFFILCWLFCRWLCYSSNGSLDNWTENEKITDPWPTFVLKETEEMGFNFQF